MALARLYAEVIIDGNRTYASVPPKLKPKVAKVLEDWGRSDLIIE